jgi:hypothetical protein
LKLDIYLCPGFLGVKKIFEIIHSFKKELRVKGIWLHIPKLFVQKISIVSTLGMCISQISVTWEKQFKRGKD